MKKALPFFQKKANNFQEFERELAIYQQNLSITPKFISANYPILTIQLLDAVPIGDMKKPDFGKMATLYSILHTKTQCEETCLCHVDCNPKNILYEEKTEHYYLIDFAESRLDYPETDVITFLLFWASIQSHSSFIKSSSQFWQAYNPTINYDRCNKLFPNLVKTFDERRKKYQKKERSHNNDTEKNRLFLQKHFPMS